MSKTHHPVGALGALLPVLVLAVLFAAPAAISPQAAAQGTFGTLPDPISTSELMSYAHRLGLSPQQRQAVLSFHDQYKREFRALREGEIAAFLSEMEQANTGGMPQRKLIEDLLKGMNRLTTKIAGVDNRLMDQIQTILTDEQVVALPRVRMARERKRLSSQWTMMLTGGPALDLSELFADLDLTPEELAAADPAINQYEIRLTSSLRDLRETSMNMIMELFDAMQEMGFDEQTIENAEEDPEAAAEMMEQMQAVFIQIMQKAMAAVGEMKELNRKTYRTVVSLLPDGAGRIFRNRFYTRTYRQAHFAIRDFSTWPEIARKAGDLDDEQCGRIDVIAGQLQNRFDEIADRAVRAIEESEGSRSPFSFDQEAWQKLSNKLSELQDECSRALEAASAQISEIAPEEAVAALRGHAERPWAEPGVAIAEEEETAGEESPEEPAWTGDMFVPAPINRRELNEYCRLLEIADAERVVIDQLHADYVAAFEQVREREIKAVTDANAALWRMEAGSGTRATPTTDAIADVYRLRRTAQQAISDLDSGFFDDLAVVFSTDEQAKRLPRLRLARQRRCYANAAAVSSGLGIPGRGTTGVDLAELIREQELSGPDLAKADVLLEEYERSLTEAMRQRFECAMAMQQANENWYAEVARIQSEGDTSAFEWGLRYQQFIGTAQKNLNDATEEISRLNEETLDELESAVGAANGGPLRRAYAKKAYPSVYNDPVSVEDHLTRAMALPDLTAEQRSRLNEIAADYRPAYEDLCRRLIELGGLEPRWGMGEEDFDWKAEQERQQNLATVRFDRDELSARAAAEMAVVLTEEQIRRIGGLPEPPEQPGRFGF
ncbi:MAG: hypothetical protein JSV91_12235 [Phycisphaerales bacterium]|nr:MAG: hypothetical protein JSV91_12235 [Phycisphaerales bacterium]